MFTLKATMNPVGSEVWGMGLKAILAIINAITDEKKMRSAISFAKWVSSSQKMVAWALMGKVVGSISLALACVGIIWWIYTSNSNEQRLAKAGGVVGGALGMLLGPLSALAGCGTGALLGQQVGKLLDKIQP